MSVPSAQVPLILSHTHTHTVTNNTQRFLTSRLLVLTSRQNPTAQCTPRKVSCPCLHVPLCDGVICDTIKDTCAGGIKIIICL